jgi:hypothetical protein
MKPHDSELLLRYLHGELDSAAAEAVAQRLLAEPDLAAQYFTLAADEATIIEWAVSMPSELTADRLRIDTSGDIAGSPHARPPETLPLPFPSPSSLRSSIWQQPRRWGWAAALLLIVLGGTFWMTAQSLRPPARLTAENNCQWKGTTVGLGKSFAAGQELELDAGTATVEFCSGATAMISAPASFTIVDEETLLIQRGRITAESTAEAQFSIVTPALKVLDLGTRFGVLVQPDGGAQVHVFEGKVQAVPIAPPVEEAPTPPAQLLSTIQAAQFDRKGKMVDWLLPDYDGFTAARLAPGVVGTTEQVRWIPTIPSSLEQGKFVRPNQICLMLERQNVELPTDVQVTFVPPLGGTRSGYKTHWGLIPKGTRVDSYLVRLDAPPAGDVSGAVEFERPIVGVIARGKQLAKTDEILGAPSVRYEKTNVDRRGLEGGEVPHEHLDVLNFTGVNRVGLWLGEKHDTLDEIRILVQSAP